MIHYFWFPYLFFNFLDGIFFPNYNEFCSFVEWVYTLLLSCFILVSAFLSAKLRLFLCFFFKSLVIILLIFCCSDYTILNCPSCSKSNAQFSVIGIMSMHDLFLFFVGTNLGPKFKSLILFWSNSSSVRFTRPS